MKMFKALAIAAITGTALTMAACTDASVASHNVSKAADNFEVDRRIVFVNGITDEHLLIIEGKCSIKDEGGQLEVICMTGPNEFKKHFLGLSNNVTYLAEHLDPTAASKSQYRVTIKPSTLIPDFEVR